MLAKELITDEIPPLKPTDNALMAIRWMDEFKVTHLPLTKGINFLGMVAEGDLMDLDKPENVLGESNLPLIDISVTEVQHVFEVVKVVSDHQLSVIPVLNLDGKYMGAISINHLMHVIAAMPVVEDSGGIIVMELNVNDFYLSQIAQIVESHDSKLLGTFITSHPDSTKLQLTLKINKADLTDILRTFERYDYNVTASYDQSEPDTGIQDRYDSLMNYLNV